MEAQIVLFTAIVGLGIMSVIYSEMGFVRLMGIGHIGWVPLVFLLWLRLDHATPGSAFGYWLIAVIVLDGVSLFIDITDVLRYSKSERQPLLAHHYKMLKLMLIDLYRASMGHGNEIFRKPLLTIAERLHPRHDIPQIHNEHSLLTKY